MLKLNHIIYECYTHIRYDIIGRSIVVSAMIQGSLIKGKGLVITGTIIVNTKGVV